MIGAFEHAVKIWEEVIPTSLPISITAKLGKLRGSQNVLSRVMVNTYSFNGGVRDYRYATYMPTIKNVLLQEYHAGIPVRFHNEIDSIQILEKPNDIEITYNIDMIGQFDFSLDGNISSNKYDFVTLAMRDIALGLGLGSKLSANTAKKEFNFTGQKLTPFETIVTNAIGSNDPKTAYINATQGTLSIVLGDYPSTADTLHLYAPNPWINMTSLQYFIPEQAKPLTKLLTYDFGKGYVMRDLSGEDWELLFERLLDWRREIPTGGKANTIAQIGTSNNILPYNGSFSISFNDNENRIFKAKEENQLSKILLHKSASTESIDLNNDGTNLYTHTYCDPYNCFSSTYPNGTGITLSALLDDGTWDCLYMVGGFFGALTLNMDDLPLHFDESRYARGTTGGLRYRLTQASEAWDNISGVYKKYKVKYFTRDFTPQAATIKYSNIYSEPENLRTLSSDDDYFVDVVIGISHLEGTKRVIVEQWDEGEPVPFQYEVEDFRDGYFIANLDRELSTQLTVVSYNENGSRRSNTITIPPIGYDTQNLTFTKRGDDISINGLNDRLLSSDKLSCTVTNVINPGIAAKQAAVKDGKVSVGDLSGGIYVLALYNGSDKIGDYKFVK